MIRLRLPKMLLLFALLATAAAAPRPASAADAFAPPCTLPFEEIKKKHPIDASCPAEGDTDKEAHMAQNRAKNNFCASGAPATLTWQNFKALQKAAEDADIPFGGSNNLPPDRTKLRGIFALPSGQKIGEGSVVRYVGFISNPRYSNTRKRSDGSAGESVNCNEPGNAPNDIHIDLARTDQDEPACRSITAEISPHFRPPAWEREHLRLVMDRPVRITGHLFFDASHRPCRNDNDKVSPKRASIWEVHPVYAIDVCRSKTTNACPAGNENKWLPLYDWLNVEEQDEEQ